MKGCSADIARSAFHEELYLSHPFKFKLARKPPNIFVELMEIVKKYIQCEEASKQIMLRDRSSFREY